MKCSRLFAGLFGFALLAAAQAPPVQNLQDEGPTILSRADIPAVDVAASAGEHDFVNYYLFVDGVYDSTLPFLTISPAGTAIDNFGGYGADIGGGVNVSKRLRRGQIVFSYRGDYLRYNRSALSNGSNQNMALSLREMLTRRWSILLSESLGYSLNGGQLYLSGASPGELPILQPYSQQFLVITSDVTFTYQATRRMSYFFGGDFAAAQYRPGNFYSYDSGTGTGGITYRLSPRTTISGALAYTRLGYSVGSISTDVENATVTLSHEFGPRWQAGITAGAGRVKISGVASILLPGIATVVQGQFSASQVTPLVIGSLTRTLRHGSFSVNGGENISPGNGVYLTSKNIFVNGTFHGQISNRLDYTLGAGYSQLRSLSTSVANFSTAGYTVGLHYKLARYVAFDANYSGSHYGNSAYLNQLLSSRATVGFTFGTRNYSLPGF